MTIEKVQELKPVEQGNYNIRLQFTDGLFETFEDILGYQINSALAAISMKDGTTFAYPLITIKSIKHYPTIKE